jgi:hypothetical protein
VAGIKKSKLGGLPNYTYEPRKPIPLGMMFQNGVESISGLLVFQDIESSFQDLTNEIAGSI